MLEVGGVRFEVEREVEGEGLNWELGMMNVELWISDRTSNSACKSSRLETIPASNLVPQTFSFSPFASNL
jgi:hypothetical protein